jgi:selenide,water dikinase
MFGLAVLGMVHPDHVFRNEGFKPGDQLILTKPLGTGTLATALKNGRLTEADILEALNGMCQSNHDAVAPLHSVNVCGATDITGFGLIGHAAELAQASHCCFVIEQKCVPAYPHSQAMFAEKMLTRAHKTNLLYAESLGPVVGDADLLLRDPQTSGGLLAGVRPEHLQQLLDALHRAGYAAATHIGEVQPGAGVRLV